MLWRRRPSSSSRHSLDRGEAAAAAHTLSAEYLSLCWHRQCVSALIPAFTISGNLFTTLSQSYHSRCSVKRSVADSRQQQQVNSRAADRHTLEPSTSTSTSSQLDRPLQLLNSYYFLLLRQTNKQRNGHTSLLTNQFFNSSIPSSSYSFLQYHLT